MAWGARHLRRRLRPADGNPGPLLNANANTNLDPDADTDTHCDAHCDADIDAKANAHPHAHSLLGYAGLYA